MILFNLQMLGWCELNEGREMPPPPSLSPNEYVQITLNKTMTSEVEIASTCKERNFASA